MDEKEKPTENSEILKRALTKEIPITYPPEKLRIIFRCKTCRAPFLTRVKLHTHYRQSHNYVICHTCNATFGDRMYLQQHYNLTHKANKTFCVPCNIACKTPEEYNVHVKSVHKKPSESVSMQSFSKGETPTKDGNWKLECKICKSILPSVEELMSHYNDKHKEKKQIHKVFHKCTICLKLFVSTDVLVEHTKEVHNIVTSVKHKCSICDAEFGTESSLVSHVSRTHKWFNKKLVTCNVCSQQFNNNHILANHMKNVHLMKSENS